ncbi:putative uncharacterized protein [Eubacterium sp. CAG:603]|nr:putative uncharacterized protein [Eubacterium sp. CAG:603]
MFCKLFILNIRRFFKNNKMMIMILLFSQIVSVVVSFMAYGMIMNTKRESESAGYSERFLDANSYHDVYLPLEKIKPSLYKLLKSYGNKVRSVVIDGYDKEENTTIWMHFTYRNGNIIVDDEWKKTILDSQPNRIGHLYTDDEFYSGKKVLVTNGGYDNVKKCYINGTEYEVVGHFYEEGYIGNASDKVVEVPFFSADDEMQIDAIGIQLATLPTVSEYNEFATEMLSLFDNQVYVYMPEKFSNDVKYMYKTYFIIAAIILGMSVINIGIVYGYILRTRTKYNAILSLCGAKKIQIVIINLLEIISMCLVSYGVSLLLFNNVIIPYGKDVFIYFTDIFDKYLYEDFLTIYLMAVIICALYNILKVLNKQTITFIRGGGRK